MTIFTKDIRVKISEEMIDKYVSKAGIDSIFTPIANEPNTWDARFITSDLSPVPSERNFKENLDNELERFKIISERAKDLILPIKSFGNIQNMVFETNENSKQINDIDFVKDESEIMGTNQDGSKQIRWTDKLKK